MKTKDRVRRVVRWPSRVEAYYEAVRPPAGARHLAGNERKIRRRERVR